MYLLNVLEAAACAADVQVDKFTMKFLRAEFERAATILQGERDPLPLLFQPREDRSSSRP